jgi:hypothetical protein
MLLPLKGLSTDPATPTPTHALTIEQEHDGAHWAVHSCWRTLLGVEVLLMPASLTWGVRDDLPGRVVYIQQRVGRLSQLLHRRLLLDPATAGPRRYRQPWDAPWAIDYTHTLSIWLGADRWRAVQTEHGPMLVEGLGQG